MKCPHCLGESSSNIKCSLCGYNLDQQVDLKKIIENNPELILKGKKKITKTVKIIISIPCIIFLLASLSITAISSYNLIEEKKQIKNYTKSTAILENIECYESDQCEGYYIYYVNGEKYTISPNKITNYDSYKEKETVWYNPDKPKESIMSADWEIGIISGATISIILIIALIIIFKKEKSDKK